MTNLFKMAALSLPVIVGLALPAAASNITNVAVPYSQAVQLSGGILLQDTGSSTLNAGITGQVVLTTDIGTLGTWCVDLLHDIYLGNSYSFTETALTSNNLDGAQNVILSAAQIKSISELSAFGDAVLQPYTSNSITASLSGAYAEDIAALSKSDLATFTSDISAFSAAIQASIWDVEYGTTATGSTNFTNDLALIASDLGAFSNITGVQLNVSGAQKQFLSTNDVPEPAALALLGSGLFAMGMFSRRRQAVVTL